MEVVNGADRLVMDNSVLEGSSQQEDKMDGGKGTEGKSGRVWAGKQGRCFPSRHVRNTSKRKVTDADLRAAADSGNKWDKYWHEREKKKKKVEMPKGHSCCGQRFCRKCTETRESRGNRTWTQFPNESQGPGKCSDSVLRIWLSFLGSPGK